VNGLTIGPECAWVRHVTDTPTKAQASVFSKRGREFVGFPTQFSRIALAPGISDVNWPAGWDVAWIDEAGPYGLCFGGLEPGSSDAVAILGKVDPTLNRWKPSQPVVRLPAKGDPAVISDLKAPPWARQCVRHQGQLLMAT